MIGRTITIICAAALFAGCSTIGRAVTVKNYTARSGERVMAGQAEPKAEYACNKLSQEPAQWTFSDKLDKAEATEKLTAAAVDAAPAKGANYAYVIVPSEASIMGFNIHAFKDAQVAYYHCASLPSATA